MRQVDLKHMEQLPGSNMVSRGIDLKDFYLSVEWDILEVPASRNEEYYPCCKEPYSGAYNITLNLCASYITCKCSCMRKFIVAA